MEILIAIFAVLPFVLVSRFVLKRLLGSFIENYGVDSLSLVLGLGQIAILIFFAGVVQLYNPFTAWSIVGIYYIISIILYGWYLPITLCKRIRSIFNGWRQDSTVDKTLILFLLILMAFNVVGAYTPQIGEDTLFYHFALPKLFIQHGGLYYYPYNFNAVSPFNIEMLFTFGMLLRNDIVANLFNVIIGIGFAWVIYVVIRSYLGHSYGVFWSVVFYSLPLTMRQTHQGFIDMGMALFAVAGFYVLLMSVKKGLLNTRIIIVAGFLFGLAAGSKVFGAVSGTLASFALFCVFLKKYKSKAVFYSFLIVVVMAMVASPWYIRSGLATGNPFYPALYSVFGGKYWNKKIDERWEKNYHTSPYLGGAPIGRSVHGLLIAPFYISYPKYVGKLFIDKIKTGEALSNERPHAGFLPVLFMPFGFLLIKRRQNNKDAVFAVVISSLFFTTWYLFMPQLARHLMPLIGFVYLISAFGLKYVLTDMRNNMARWVGIASCGLWLIFSLGIYTVYIVPKAYSAINKDKYLEQYTSFYEVIKWVNSNLGQGQKLAIVSEFSPYYLDVPYIHLGPSFSLSELNDKSGLYNYLLDNGVTHLLVLLDESGNYYLKELTINPGNVLFRSDDPLIPESDGGQFAEPLMELIADGANTKLVYKGTERKILSKTPPSYGELIQVRVYELQD